jgi:hypothetical protein
VRADAEQLAHSRIVSTWDDAAVDYLAMVGDPALGFNLLAATWRWSFSVRS